MQIREISCKTALSQSKLPGLTYSLNPYRGCEHNCAYCYVPSVLRIKNEIWGEFVEIKKNIPNILSKELKKKKSGVVGISTVTDPYQPIEKKYKLTRYCLKQLLKYDFPVSIQTKSSFITRDIDILSQFSNSEIFFSIATLNDKYRQILEPNSSSIKSRFDALNQCIDAEINSNIFFGPIYPAISVDDVYDIIDKFKEYNVLKIMIDTLNLKPGIWQNIIKRIQKDQKLHSLFLKNIVEDKNYYSKIRDAIFKIGKDKNIKIFDAF